MELNEEWEEIVKNRYTQKEAIYKFLLLALEEEHMTLMEFKILWRQNREQIVKIRRKVWERLFKGIKTGEIPFSKDQPDWKIRKYCSKIFYNWVTKDRRLR